MHRTPAPPDTTAKGSDLADLDAFLLSRAGGRGGLAYLEAVSTFLGERLGVAYVFFGFINPMTGKTVRTAALYANGNIIPDIEYDLSGSPCEVVMGDEVCLYERGVQQLFPDDVDLAKMDAESYVGLPLFGSGSELLGICVIIDTKPIEKPTLARQMLQATAVHTGHEMERILTERAMHDNQTRFEDAQAMGRMGDFEWHLPSGKVRWSRGICRMLGYPEDTDMDYATVNASVHHPDDLPIVNAWINQVMTTDIKQTNPHVYRLIHKDGHAIHVRTTAKVDRDSDGAPIAVHGTCIDITELATIQSDLMRAKEAAEAANHAKTDFLAAMSHELRTPLNAINGFSEMMKSQVFGDLGHTKYLEYADDIHSSATHLTSLVNDILDLSKVEARAVDLRPTRFSLSHAIKDAIGLIRLRAGRDPSTIEVRMESEMMTLWADLRSFRQIMVNLLSNADKYTPADSPIFITAATGKDRNIIVVVRDTGIGVEQKDMLKILEPFGQVRDNAELAHQGTGLGLPLSQGLMHLHGGTLDMTSTPGAGTTVTLTFPPAPEPSNP